MAPWTQQAKNGTWRAEYRDAAGRKRYTSGHRTRKEAQRAAVIEETETRRGQRRDPTSHRMRYAQWVERWKSARPVSDSTARSDKPRLAHHVIPRWGTTRLSEISRMDVQTWVNELHREPQPPRNRPLGPKTVRHCFHLLSSSLKMAVAENILDSNPCTDVRLPTLPLQDHRYLTDDEIDALFDRLDGWRRMLVELLLDSGLRIGEGAGLHEHRCHLRDNDPHVTVFETWDPDHRVMRPHPKGKQRRDVPLGNDLAEMLKEYWRFTERPATCLERHEGGACRSPLAIPNLSGRPIDQSNFSQREWAQAVRESGVVARPHDLRHTYASRAISAGVTLETLQGLMGHVSFATTKQYAHLMDSETEQRRQFRALMSNRRAASTRQPDRHRSGGVDVPDLGSNAL